MSITARKSFEFTQLKSGPNQIHGGPSHMFEDLYSSAMGKAMKISPTTQGVTLGPNALVVSCDDPEDTFLPTPPQIASTPKKTKIRLSDRLMRRPTQKTPYFEIKSKEELQPKALLAEINKKIKNDCDRAVAALESETKEQERQIVDQLARLHISLRGQRDAQNIAVEKILLQTYLSKRVVEESEKDKIAESKAYERSEKVRQNVEEAKKKSAALQEKKRLYDIMSVWQKEYTEQYSKLLNILQSCQDMRALQEKISVSLRSLQDDIPVTENLRMKVMAEELTAHDLKISDIAMENLLSVLNVAKTEVEKINNVIAKKENDETKAEEEKRDEAVRAKIGAEEVKENTSEASTLADCFDAQSMQRFARLRAHLSAVQSGLEPLLKDPAMSKFRFELKKAVTLPVNAISGRSGADMMDKHRKLYNLLAGQRAEGGAVAASDHPLGGLLAQDLLAKLFVRQGEMAVSSKPEAAFPIASILVNLWVDFPDFGELVLAHFYRCCPYLAPVFLPQLEGQTDQDYYKFLGYQVQNGEVESQEMFQKRMKGVMRLLAAILITNPRDPTKPHPLGLAEAWRWLAAILNLEPRAYISPVLILELLEVAGHDLLMIYRGQMKKVLAYICTEYFPRLDKVTAPNARGPLTRLETFLERAAKEGNIPPPARRLPHNFW